MENKCYCFQDERIRELEAALRKLRNEVGGLRAFEPEVRAAIGNTNWECLFARAAIADSLLGSEAMHARIVTETADAIAAQDREGDPSRYPMTGAYAPTATCKHGDHPYYCRQGCDPHEHARYYHLHDRIRKLEAALRARGHTDICVTRVRGNFPCDCGLEAALSPDTIPFTDKPGGSLPWKCSKCGDLNSSWQTFCSKCTQQICSAPSDATVDREGEPT